MKIPHKCPVCNGQGTMLKPPWVAGDQMWWVDTGTAPYKCRPCKGEGVLWREEEIPSITQGTPSDSDETEDASEEVQGLRWCDHPKCCENRTYPVEEETPKISHRFPEGAEWIGDNPWAEERE